MVTCGIELSQNKAIFCFLKKESDGNILNTSDKKVSFELTDDENQAEVKTFNTILRNLLDSFNPDKIGIVKRQKKGKFAGGPLSFKLEGLLQLYPNGDVILVPSATFKSFAKKNETNLKAKFKYQENALLLSWYLMNK